MPIEPNPYLTPEILDASRAETDPVIVYIIVRESLGMSPGKLAVQVGHGIQMLMLGHDDMWEEMDEYPVSSAATCQVTLTQEWFQSAYRKIVLSANDKEFEKIKKELDCFLVIDAGLTELVSGSETVACLWPMRKSHRPKLISRLRLLK